jgi:hypothetical protein
MITRDEILKAYPLRETLEKMGVVIETKGKEQVCRCLFHDDHNPSMRLNFEKEVWFCDPCGFGGSVIDLFVRLKGLSVKETLYQMIKDANLVDPFAGKKHKVETYEYRDAYGREVMFVDRLEKDSQKEFLQYQITPKGEKVFKIEGVQRVLYRMEKWSGLDSVSLAEGEKCVHALESLGINATTNAGGSSGWLDSYSNYLLGKNVDIYPDNDQAGEKWLEKVLKSLEGKVESLRVIRIPKIYNDIADMVMAQGVGIASENLINIFKQTPPIKKGVLIPLLSADEYYREYKKRVMTIDENGIDLSKWIPKFKEYVRVLQAGDMAVFLSDTGVGKTTVLSNIALSIAPLNCIFFELELSSDAMCERFLAHSNRMSTYDIERTVKNRTEYSFDGFKHIFICPKSNITVDEMENIINRSELKIGKRPACIFVDYIGLINGGNIKRYERLSNIAESLKILARSTNTVIIIASQVSRDDEREEISLHDAKDSGSIENSAQLVIGVNRPDEDKMNLKILKNTKKTGHPTIECDFWGDLQRITQKE